MKGRQLDHLGIRVELVGMIQGVYDQKLQSQFLSLIRDLEPPGSLNDNVSYDFQFGRVDKQFQSYNGSQVKLRSYGKITKEEDFVVEHLQLEPDANPKIQMEVGIEDYLLIGFEFLKSKFHIKDCIEGRITFIQIKLRIKHMELSIIKKETINTSNNQQSVETETLSKFEIMDGGSIKGENVPVRFYLSSTKLTPTYRNVNNKFSVKYQMMINVIDDEDRRYFRYQDIELWRKKI
ncbi:hbeta58 vps26 protein [Stylonychia lemnae]|uniref:Hbeta58 vps26 protein n=1 Tax=Stylonychia lemnae TaxID=5949 RepID=A0A078B8S0_STYLE|nr:hbeta58 vps26 protein [Stylonychia lemnae]|eukprot:CDW90814.1 hbeta58 vps26 protein [Stylonychia lemnae]